MPPRLPSTLGAKRSVGLRPVAPLFSSRSALPAGPSCSRWLTCTCCRPSTSTATSSSAAVRHQSFFSANRSQPLEGYPVSSSPTTFTDDHEHVPSPRVEEDDPTSTSPIRLPILPPSLPYTPNSIPFRLHLSALTSSLSFQHPASSETSWQIFDALHPSLHVYIPFSILHALLLAQLRLPDRRTIWDRATAIIRIAGEQGEPPTAIRKAVLLRVLEAGAGCLSSNERGSRSGPHVEKEYVELFSQVIQTTKGDWRGLPLDLRTAWMGIMIRWDRYPERAQEVDAAVRGCVQGRGGRGMEDLVAKLLVGHKGQGDLERCRARLRLLIFCWTCELHVKRRTTRRVLERVHAALPADSNDALLDETEAALSDFDLDSTSSSSSTIPVRLRVAAQLVVRKARPQVDKAADIRDSDDATIGQIMRQGLKLVKRVAEQPDPAQALETAIALCERVLLRRSADATYLISSLLATFSRAYQDGSSATSSSIPLDTLRAHTTRLLRSVLSSESLPFLDPHLVHRIFHLTRHLPPSPTTLALARDAYAAARGVDPAFTWTISNLYTWTILFRRTLTSPRPAVHFASRLYADLQADGLRVPRQSALLMIRAIGGASSSTRGILLDRHLKDYLWLHYGKVDQLVEALVDGLTARGRLDDAVLAHSLADRLLDGKPFPVPAAHAITRVLAPSYALSHAQISLNILSRMPPAIPGDPALRTAFTSSFENVLSQLVVSSQPHASAQQVSKSAGLVYAVKVYKQMIALGIPPSSHTVSLLIRAMTSQGYLDHARRTLEACVGEGIAVKSSVVAKLMLRLATSGRVENADDVERIWRSSSVQEVAETPAYDKPVRAARVLVDLLKGDGAVQELSNRFWAVLWWLARDLERDRAAALLDRLQSIRPSRESLLPQEEVEVDKEVHVVRQGEGQGAVALKSEDKAALVSVSSGGGTDPRPSARAASSRERILPVAGTAWADSAGWPEAAVVLSKHPFGGGGGTGSS